MMYQITVDGDLVETVKDDLKKMGFKYYNHPVEGIFYSLIVEDSSLIDDYGKETEDTLIEYITTELWKIGLAPEVIEIPDDLAKLLTITN